MLGPYCPERGKEQTTLTTLLDGETPFDLVSRKAPGTDSVVLLGKYMSPEDTLHGVVGREGILIVVR